MQPVGFRGSWLAALPFLLAACARVPPPDLSADPTELLRAVEAAQARVLRVEGRARIGADGEAARGSADALVAAERPDRLRVELLDFFGAPAALLVVAEGRFLFFDARQGTWTRGEATPENVSRLLPLSLPAAQAVALLCGAVPLLPAAPIAAAPGDGVMRLTLAEVGGSGRQQRLDVGAGAAVEASRIVRLLPGGAEEPAGPTIRLGAFALRSGIRFPGELTVESGSSSRLRVAWRDDLLVNGPERPGVFDLAPPPGARVVDLQPGAGAGPHLPLPGGE